MMNIYNHRVKSSLGRVVWTFMSHFLILHYARLLNGATRNTFSPTDNYYMPNNRAWFLFDVPPKAYRKERNLNTKWSQRCYSWPKQCYKWPKQCYNGEKKLQNLVWEDIFSSSSESRSFWSPHLKRIFFWILMFLFRSQQGPQRHPRVRLARDVVRAARSLKSP